MKRFVRTFLLFMIVPVLLFCILEIRSRVSEEHFWFDEAAREIAVRPADFIFIGSSRVAAAVDVRAFAASISDRTGRPCRALNLGMGYSTVPEYFFGLKKLLKRSPNCLRGKTVLIEAPFQLPASDTWDDDWLKYPQLPYHLSPYLEWDDLLNYCKLRGVPITNKELVVLGKISAFSVRAIPIREKFISSLERVTDKLVDRVLPSQRQTNLDVDLRSDGGIRTDEHGVELVRSLAVESFENSIHFQRPIDWERTVMKDLVELARDNGGQIVFFDIPLCSLQARAFQTKRRRLDSLAFKKLSVDWGFRIVNTDFKTVDNDFPDLWHLRKSKSSDFSKALAEAYCEGL